MFGVSWGGPIWGRTWSLICGTSFSKWVCSFHPRYFAHLSRLINRLYQIAIQNLIPVVSLSHRQSHEAIIQVAVYQNDLAWSHSGKPLLSSELGSFVDSRMYTYDHDKSADMTRAPWRSPDDFVMTVQCRQSGLFHEITLQPQIMWYCSRAACIYSRFQHTEG